jgi:mitochondrial fission protein ELM1
VPERSLQVWVLSDGQPGHFNQSRGIVLALRMVRPVKVSWIDVRLRFGLARKLLRWYLNRASGQWARKALQLFYRMDALPQQPCELIVSAGGNTSFANVWLAQLMGVPNVFAGSLRGLDPALFRAVLTLEPIAGAASSLPVMLPPSPIQAGAASERGERLRARLGTTADRYWTLLLGGDGAGYRYREEDWRALQQLLKSLSHQYGIRWLIASSRRTGPAAERLLRDGLGSGAALQCWYTDGDVFHIEEFLGAAERVFVTEDSMTMLTEAIYSQRPVHSLAPRRAKPDERFSRALQRFVEQGWLCRHGIDELLSHPERIEQHQCRLLSESPAMELGERLGSLIFQND